MVNAWSLADSVINGTLDEDYPIMTKKHESYDDFENPLPDQITLTDKEVEEGLILTCQSRISSSHIEISYDDI